MIKASELIACNFLYVCYLKRLEFSITKQKRGEVGKTEQQHTYHLFKAYDILHRLQGLSPPNPNHNKYINTIFIHIHTYYELF